MSRSAPHPLRSAALTLMTALAGLLLADAWASAGVGAEISGTPENVVELGRWSDRSGASGLAWYTTAIPEDRYILVGVSDGTAVVEASDPSAMTEIGFVPGVPSSRRAIAPYLTLAYVVSADGGGLQIINIADPESPAEISSEETVFQLATHLLVDSATQRLFVSERTAGRFLVFDLSTPLSPTLIGTVDEVFATRGLAFADELVYAGVGNALAILDVSGLPAISLAAYVTYPSSGTGAVVLDRTRALAFATDDRPGGALSVFDVASLGASVHLTRTVDLAGTAVTGIALDDLTVYTAGASAGLVATDVSDPRVPEPFAQFPSEEGRDVISLGGGMVLLTDHDAGLLALGVEPALGTIAGALTVSGSGEAATSVTVRVREAGKTFRTGGDGTYRLRVAPGAYRVVFDRWRFEPDSVDVVVNAGESVTLDRELVDRPTGTLRGNITRLARSRGRTAEPRHPEGTFVAFLDAPVDAVQAFDGFYFRPFLPVGSYLIEAREFGTNSVQAVVTVTAGGTTIENFSLEPAPIVDTFETDSGWSVDPSDTATSGRWERAVPVGTAAGYVAPDRDETPAPGVTAFVTGLGTEGDWIDVHDVDGGTTTLISPAYDLGGIDEPVLQFYHWFSDDARSAFEGGSDDAFAVDVSTDGGDTWTLVHEIDRSRLFWKEVSIVLSRHVVPSSETHVRFRVTDGGVPSVVEAAIDDFAIWDGRYLLTLPNDTPILLDVTGVESIAPGRVILRWRANGPVEHFTIERSHDGGEPIVLAEVLPQATRDHTYVDASAPRTGQARYWIEAHAPFGVDRVGPIQVTFESSGAVVSAAAFPNPARDVTSIRVETPAAAETTRLSILDVRGRTVRVLLDRSLEAGRHVFHWDGRMLEDRRAAAGVYWYRLEIDGATRHGSFIRR